MEYTVSINNNKYGPINELTLENWVEEGRILPESIVKDCESGETIKAKDLSFLTEAFILQAKNFKQNLVKSTIGIKQNLTLRTEVESEETVNSLDLSQVKYLIRVKAALIDMMFLLFLACIFFLGINFMIFKEISTIDFILYVFFPLIFSTSIMYFAFQISYFRRTFGMRLFGLIMTRNSDVLKDIFLFRSFFYTIIMILSCMVNFILVYIGGYKIVLQNIITDINVIRSGN